MRQKALLIGNGVNNIKQTYSWSDLVDDLIRLVKAEGKIEKRTDKPFPLLYEEIFVEAVSKGIKEKEIKDYIANRVIRFEPNHVHKELLSLDVSHILTTNYDFSFEKVFTEDLNSLKNEGQVKESLYSIFRCHTLNKIKFWHIHGDANAHNSITLGYEHYSGYLQQMRNYVLTGTGNSYKNKKFDPVIKRLRSKKGIKESASWLDLFFTHDIYIIGLTLDFMEIHLWWLLACRQRMKLVQKVPIKNKIVYFYPEMYENGIKSKLDLLKASGIDTFPISIEPSREEYYLEVVHNIRNGD